VCLFTTTFAYAKDYTFAWSANPEPVEGYRLYYKKGGAAEPPFDGSDSLDGPSPIDIGKLTTSTISGLEDDTTYHFALTAYYGNDESAFSQVITVFPDNGIEFNFELQEIEIGHNWTRFDFTQPFFDPVVVAGPPSFNGAQPATVRVRNIDATGCEIRIQEWDYLDGYHVPETLTFLAMERGAYTADNGSKIEAGTFTGTTSFQQIDLLQTYNNKPVILSQVITENEMDALTGRLRNLGTNSFEYIMQEQGLTPTAHGTETIGYIAWEPGAGAIFGLPYEAGFTPQEVTHKWYNIIFKTNFPNLPLMVAGMQTYRGSDTAAIRSQTPSANSIQVKIEEESSADEEINHTTEVIGYLIIGAEMSTEETDTP
jgi:hypothetical protein